ETLAKDFPSVHFFRNEANEGFTGAVNRGLKEARTWNPQFYFILNNDAQVEPETLPALESALERHPRAGLAAPKIFGDAEKKVLWAAGGEVISWKFMGRNRGQGFLDNGAYGKDENLDFLSGCALMVRKEAVEKLGMLDEDFFTYAEDLDYSLRARAAGWDLLYVSGAHVIHEGSVTSGGQYEPFQSFYRWRNRFLLARKHGNFIHKSLFFCFFAPTLMLRDLGVYLLKGHIKSIPYLFYGLVSREPLRTVKPSRLKLGYLLSNPVSLVMIFTADFFGGILWHFFKKRKQPSEVKKILVAKIDHLGDVTMALHMIPVLKKAFPSAEIHFLCGSWTRWILEKNPDVSAVFSWDDFRLNRDGSFPKRFFQFLKSLRASVSALRLHSYDIVFDLRAYYPNFIPFMPLIKSKYRVGYSTAGFGFLLDKTGPWQEGLHETEHMLRLVQAVAPGAKRELPDLSSLAEPANDGERQEPFVIIHPFCEKSFLKDFKRWKPEEWRKIIAAMEKRGIQVVCSGDSFDRPKIEEIIRGSSAVNAAGKISVGALSALIRRSLFTVCIDTFFAHLSGALGAKTFEIFNDGEPVAQWKAYGPHVKTFPIESNASDILSSMESNENRV
ncbi:MAG: hypothetical protein A2901_02640, partial [Elusimicrobia bacterium RIFCSPLOWO2_01_FULL_54_10]